jgi:hypothetical protein
MKGKLLPHLEAEQEVLYQRLEMGKSEEEIPPRGCERARHGRAPGPENRRHARPDVRPMDRRVQGLAGPHRTPRTGFNCARDEFSKEELEAMGRQFQTRKAQLSTSVA